MIFVAYDTHFVLIYYLSFSRGKDVRDVVLLAGLYLWVM